MNPTLWRFLLRHAIIPRRAPESATKYQAIWTDEGAPLTVMAESLARKLEKRFDGKEDDVIVRAAMSYSSPTIEDALGDCRDAGHEEIIVLPLYPQSAYSTTECVRDKFDEALRSCEWKPDVRFIENYGDHLAYIEALQASIHEAGFDPAAGDKLLFAFHSIPLSDIHAGDTYNKQTERTVELLAQALDLDRSSYRIGYQCRFDKSRSWLGPTTKEALASFGDVQRLFVIAPNFSIDCLETLYDIDIELRKYFKKLQEGNTGAEFRFIPCLNDTEEHVNALASICG